jgi:hypothetical protein
VGALILTLVCGSAALPATAQEFQIDITGETGDQVPGTVSFDISSSSGTQVYNADSSFSFTNVAITNFSSSINGAPFLSATTATGLWAKDVSPFGGFQITGPGGTLFSTETDLATGIAIDPNAPLYSFLSQDIFPASLGGLGNLNFDSQVVKITPVATSAPEPGSLPLIALGGALLLISRRRQIAPKWSADSDTRIQQPFD